MSKAVNLKFDFDWRSTALVILFLPIVTSLGFWQLDRAEEKRALQALFMQRQAGDRLDVSELTGDEDLRYQPVTMQGEFINDKTIYLDNRIYQGRFGYEIITPLQLDDGRMILVNRGWLAGDSGRRSLPAIEDILGEQRLQGEVYVPHKNRLNNQQTVPKGWPKVMQSLSASMLAGELGELFPYTIRMTVPAAGSYQPNWAVVNLQPSKHTGYAFQWFSMAVALIVIALLSNTNLWNWLKYKNRNR